MRLKIKQRIALRTPFVFLLPGETVEVWRQSAFSGHLTWKWIDGSFASMRLPHLDNDSLYHGEFCAGRLEVTSGVLHSPFIGPPRVDWQCGEKILSVETHCCRGTVALDGRRVAVWRVRSQGAECVLRDSLPSDIRNIVLGVMVGHIFQDGR
ncbi:MAG TPA: hypothetical protein VGN12_16300 [Pirellulales bacterium]